MRVLATLPPIANPLPYDAEVEWIGFRGAQYIDIPNTTNYKTYELKVKSLNASAEQCYVGCRSGSTNRCYPLYQQGGKWRLIYGYANVVSSSVDSNVVTIKSVVNSGYQSISVNDADEVTASSVDTVLNSNIVLGAASVVGNKQLYINADIYGLTIKSATSGELVRDFIPVRVGSVGYMYDKVSGNLFGNAGSGSFVVGNDIRVIRPLGGLMRKANPMLTTSDYAQDGLIAMWDAIENVGLERHNNSSDIWKDLVGNRDLTLTSSGSWIADALVCDGSNTAASLAGQQISGINHIEVVYTDAIGNVTDNYATRIIVVAYRNSTNLRRGLWIRRYNGANAFSDGTNAMFMGITTNARSVSYNYAESKGYINGESKSVSGSGTVPQIPSNAIAVGGNGTNNANYNWDGKVHSIRIYNRALTAEEIAHNYEVDKERFKL